MTKAGPPAEYDGPTINGRPALNAENVQKWCEQACCGCAPSLGDAAHIAAMVNHYDFLGALWKNTPEFKQMHQNNTSTLRMRRISKALTILQNDLPVAIDDTRKVFPDPQSDRLVVVVALLHSVNLLAPIFQKFAPRGAGREPEPWHRIAREVTIPRQSRGLYFL